MLAWWHYLIVFTVALVVTVALVPLVRKLAVALGVVDNPGPRRVNKEPIPRLGGLAMFGGLLAAVLVEAICESLHFWNGPFIVGGLVSTRMVGVLIGLTFMVVVGVLDDIYSLRPWIKLFGQIIAAIIIACSGVLLSNFKLPFVDSVVSMNYLAYPITVIYLVCFANVINLIDGLDGLAAGITGIAALSLFALTVGLMRSDPTMMSLVLVAICVGFLFYNFNPATIFMGDSGSLLLGLLLGTVSLLGATRFSSITALAVPVVIAGVPVIDTFSAIVRRLRGHQRITAADAGHIHHRLLKRGFSQRKSVLFIYAWTALLCAGGCIIWMVGGLLKYLVLIALLVISALIVHKLGLFGPVLQHHYYPDENRDPWQPGAKRSGDSK